MRELTAILYALARVCASVAAIERGPGSTANRGKNIAVGRSLGRAGVWNRLWRKW